MAFFISPFMGGPRGEGAAQGAAATHHCYSSLVMQQCCPLNQDSYCRANCYRRGELKERKENLAYWGERPPKMIISTWATYILIRKSIGCRFPPNRAPVRDIEVAETEMLSVLEHWLRKIEEEASKIFKQKLEKKVENKAETKTETKTTPSAGQDSGITKSQKVQVSSTKLPASSSSHGLLEERTRVQFIRWSHTQVYRVSSDVRNEATRERLEKVRNSVSQVMLQAMQSNMSNTDIRASLSS